MQPGRLSLAVIIVSAGILWVNSDTSTAQSANAVAPAGDVIVEPATLISAGFEWRIDGDANRNAAVAVTYRKRGDSDWRKGLPLLRIGGERTVFEGALDYTAPNMFAGSLFNLTENTEYEVQLTLSDPDGVSAADSKGTLTTSVTLRTRAEPQGSTAGRTFHVYPPGHQGVKQEPAFLGLLSAYYIAAIGGDWSRGHRRACARATQSSCRGRLQGLRSHELQQGITFRNTTAIEAGQKGIAGAEGLTVKHSRVEDVGVGIHSDWSGSKNFYIADNTFIGRNDPDAVFGWLNQWPWSSQPGFEQQRKLKVVLRGFDLRFGPRDGLQPRDAFS
jgi:hypothetical protein